MKRLEATITDNLVSTMKNINAIEKTLRERTIFRAAGFLEGILYTTGRLTRQSNLF
jgi:hypothetical protein